MNPKLVGEATENLRAQAVRKQTERRRYAEALYERLPRLRELDGLLQSTMVAGMTAILRERVDPAEAVQRAAQENLSVQAERTQLLRDEGIDPASLEPDFHCARCEDKLEVGGVPCVCLRDEVHRLQLRDLARKTDMRPPPEAQGAAGALLNEMRAYAEGFSPESPSILLNDDMPAGKGFLCRAVLSAVSAQGRWVEYESAGKLFSLLEAERFDRLREEDGDPRRYFQCDLLVLDDFGTEFLTAFTKAAAFELLNTRLNEQRPTLVCTSLTLDKLAQLYPPQLLSRFKGSYRILI